MKRIHQALFELMLPRSGWQFNVVYRCWRVAGWFL